MASAFTYDNSDDYTLQYDGSLASPQLARRMSGQSPAETPKPKLPKKGTCDFCGKKPGTLQGDIYVREENTCLKKLVKLQPAVREDMSNTTVNTLYGSRPMTAEEVSRYQQGISNMPHPQYATATEARIAAEQQLRAPTTTLNASLSRDMSGLSSFAGGVNTFIGPDTEAPDDGQHTFAERTESDTEDTFDHPHWPNS